MGVRFALERALNVLIIDVLFEDILLSLTKRFKSLRFSFFGYLYFFEFTKPSGRIKLVYNQKLNSYFYRSMNSIRPDVQQSLGNESSPDTESVSSAGS